MEGFIIFIIVACIFVTGVLIGDNNPAWTKDCDTIQVHRVGNSVYKCEKIK